MNNVKWQSEEARVAAHVATGKLTVDLPNLPIGCFTAHRYCRLLSRRAERMLERRVETEKESLAGLAV